MANHSNVVVRPLWRAFGPKQRTALAKHARAGGLSVFKPEQGSWILYGDAGPAGEPLPLLVDFAVRAIEAARWAEVTEAPLEGLVAANITKGWRARVDEWIARDAEFKGATTETAFDCMACAACCFDNHVVLDDEDMLRLKQAALLDKIERRKGVNVLPLLKTTKACVHLRKDLACGIYRARPSMCREFPAGSEQCMASREQKYGGPFLP